ncbi:MAG: ANTAR domain-containing protein [Sphaerochaetaceae bacterium]
MSPVLVVSAVSKGAEALSTLIRQVEGQADITLCGSATEARRLVLDYEYDLVVINTPLGTENAEDLCRMIVEETLFPVVLIVNNELFMDIQEQLENCGVLVVAKPIIREVFFQTLGIAKSLRRRLLGMQDEKNKLQKKIEEIKMVDQAKWSLVRNLGMDENQAHRYIEKQAMDQRKSRFEIAYAILRTYK